VRVSQLLADLVIEIEDAKLTLKEETNYKLNSEAKERVQQYDNLHLKDKLCENGWYVLIYFNIEKPFMISLYVLLRYWIFN